MALDALDHFSLCLHPERMAETVAFYRDVLGLTEGTRPAFPFPGHWMYCGPTAVVHLIGLGDDPAGPPLPTGRLDHIAFRATGVTKMRAHLASLGVAYEERSAPLVALTQLFIRDPNGVVVELTYVLGAE
jgi:catechol 2,3-dioxygenase-like lactoylglutathione lyase family enzyme